MSQGILLFAHNTANTNYALMAAWTARRVEKYLGVPVSLVTDKDSVISLKDLDLAPYTIFDQIIYSNEISDQKRPLGDQWVPFRNTDRVSAYALSPYDETLVIDTDIAIASDRLNRVWGNHRDLLVSQNARDILGRTHKGFDYLKDHGVPFYWATECYFRKGPEAEAFFKHCARVKENYAWASIVYGIPSSPLRNDHVWSIALHELGGTSNARWADTIPGTLVYSMDRDRLLDVGPDSATVLAQDKDRHRVARVVKQDLHIINKFDLMPLIIKEMEITQ